MKTKIKTRIGYLCLPDERMAENAATAYNKISKQRDIDIIQITSNDAKKDYRTVNPFGIGYTNCFEYFLDSQISVMKLNSGKIERKIDFLEIS